MDIHTIRMLLVTGALAGGVVGLLTHSRRLRTSQRSRGRHVLVGSVTDSGLLFAVGCVGVYLLAISDAEPAA